VHVQRRRTDDVCAFRGGEKNMCARMEEVDRKCERVLRRWT